MDDSSDISFKLLSQDLTLGNDVIDDVTEWVALNQKTGVISVTTPIDREKYCNADKTKQCVIHLTVSTARPHVFSVNNINYNKVILGVRTVLAKTASLLPTN